MVTVYKNLHYFPLTLFFLFPITFLTTYAIAVGWDHVAPILPYISETGDMSPESCIFTQMLNIGALIMGICIYIRFRQVTEFNKLYPNNSVPEFLNTLSVFLGTLTCIGLDMAANFQASRSGLLHFIGASMCFISGTMYFCIQACITSNMTPFTCPECMTFLRSILAALSIILTVSTIFPGVMSVKYFKGDNYKRWTPDDGGWEWHIVSVISEWLLSMIYCTYILTFTPEFRRIRFTAPIIQMTDDCCEIKEVRQEVLHV